MTHRFISLAAGLAALALPAAAETVSISALGQPVEIRRDSDGVSHISAQNAHDLFVAQGWRHAEDRLFQMDLLRRQASGTLAELLGPAAMAQDVELRTIGLRRAAERSLAKVTKPTRMAFRAYAEGVNAYIAAHAAALPPEYGALGVASVEPWTMVDSLAVAKLLAFGLSFDIDIAATIEFETYRAVGDIAGFDGAALYFEDTHRSAPFDPAATVPDALGEPVNFPKPLAGLSGKEVPGRALGHAKRYLERIKDLAVFEGALHPNRYDRGSNAWAVAGWRTVGGRALLASDPHLQLTTPAVFHPIHLSAPSAGWEVIGDSLPGTPFVLLGQNAELAWGATTHRMDVTDTYLEEVALDPNSPSGLSTVHQGNREPLIPVPQVFRYNGFDGTLKTAAPNTVVGGAFIPEATLISPRRNMGPVVDIELPDGAGPGSALTIQYTGFSGTREADYFRMLNQAGSLDDVVAALRFMDVGAQHYLIATRGGDIAYFTNAEVPLREDLEAGIPGYPFMIRDGTGGHEWLIAPGWRKIRATPYQIVPFNEMPRLVNPPSGFIVNANNDPLGLTLDNNPLNQVRPTGGLFYLGYRWSFGTRAGRIRDALAEKLAGDGLISFVDMQEIQADVVMLDAQVLAPRIVEAYSNALGSANEALMGFALSDPRLAEAVERLAAWDGSAPTGIPQGFDAADVDGGLSLPGADEVEASIAATIYSVWRARIVANTVDAVLEGIEAAASVDLPPLGDELAMTALRHLFDGFEASQGVGASGLQFFNGPFGVPADDRDFIVLISLQEALDALAGPAFDAAFGGSTDQDDYRWGRLHRLTLAHPLGAPFSAPPAFGAIPDLDPLLPGLAVDGGFGTVDASTHRLRAEDAQGFVFADGPVRRYVGEAGDGAGPFVAENGLPGGASGVPGSPLQFNLLGRWLTNDSYVLRQSEDEIAAATAATVVLAP